MTETENDVTKYDTTCATFYIDKLPDSISLAYFPDNIQQWIELHGFDFYTICSSSSEILYVSPSVEKILNYTSVDLIGERIVNYLSPIDRQSFIRDFNPCSTETQQFVTNVRNLYGKYIWIDSSIASIYITDTEEMVYISLAKDITDKREAEEMLIRSEKMSVAGQLAAGVAHEIRNPLTSLKGFIQILQAGIERKEEYYQIMLDEIEKIDTISSELLFISKPMTDKKKLEPMSPMVNEVVTLLKTQAKRKQIVINVQIRANVFVHCDRTQIKQVFINLIKNAIEAMDGDGTITVKVSADEKICIIEFIDQGSGIPKHLLHKLKEPFFTTKKDGTGLGLMISNKIIENHQGSMEIRSIKGEGSTFCIRLPLTKES
ncbi:Sporulation kinase A [Paraliobacillus sp. PM-2]|uniref:ATP-binding protein n=1 Tax=Paraliobacillus sp. PM-2 TaxID=1462524 RepID=UPI00061C90C9|nr:ATP-binding protein [Paraliobacillus sp. PM-2]CQR47596.1 Sporulation kinase A [Paraliobacillus sp. PM-2]